MLQLHVYSNVGIVGIIRYCKVLYGKVGQESDWSVGGSPFHFVCHSFGPLSDQSDHSICCVVTMGNNIGIVGIIRYYKEYIVYVG